MDTALVQRFELFGIAVLLALSVVSFAFRLGYFRLPQPHFAGPPEIKLSDVLSVFGVFLGLELFICPSLILLAYSIKTGHMLDPAHLHFDPITQGWINLFVIATSALGIIFYTWLISPLKRHVIWWNSLVPKTMKESIRNFLFGAGSWALAYPLIITLSQIIGLISYIFGPPPHIDQVAVKQLKNIFDHPLLFTCTALVIICLVPIAEEILFRGFLQRWLVKNLGRLMGIILTAALFAVFHFSLTQKWENIELILSLFILACLLGFIYERQGVLWAPIGLHVTFNAISVFMIIWEKFSS